MWLIFVYKKMTEESFLSILLYFFIVSNLLHDLFSMYCWCSNGVFLRLKVSMFTEFVLNFGSCLSLNIFLIYATIIQTILLTMHEFGR